MTYDYAITFACYNSVHYTKTFVDSLIKAGTPLDRIIVVDNGSTDETRDYLLTLQLGGRIFNKSNQACGVAWNQGILHLQAEWSVVMNNDLIVPHQWIENLIETAIANNLSVISPAMMEGELNYDFDAFALESSEKMKNVLKRLDISEQIRNYLVLRIPFFFTILQNHTLKVRSTEGSGCIISVRSHKMI
jgi:N-acetylglucosaminyl-diphospho-decaprenol L-rhamnosyltransferase